MKKKMIIGYCRTYRRCRSTDIQKKAIQRYCAEKEICCDQIVADRGFLICADSDEEMDEDDDNELEITEACKFPAWQILCEMIKENKIDTIIVDHKMRLYANAQQKKHITDLVSLCDVRIIEVFPYHSAADVGKAYCPGNKNYVAKHKRSTIFIKAIEALYRHASQYEEWEVMECIDLLFENLLNVEVSYE